MEIETKRDKSIDILRGIGIIIMIMGHSSFGDQFNTYKVAFNMPLFFFISGYLFSIKKYKTFLPYLVNKTKTIILPYCFFAVLTITICTIINLLSGNQVYQYLDMVKGIIWSNQNIFPITGAIWFLQCLFWVEIGYFFFERYLKNKIRWVCVIAVTGITWLLSVQGINLPFSIDSALGALLFFHIGKQWKKIKKLTLSDTQVWIKIVLWVTLFAVNVVLIFVNKPVNPRTCEYGFLPLYYVNGIMGITVFWSAAKVIQKWDNNPLCIVKTILQSIGINSLTYLGLNQLMIMGFFTAISSLHISSAVMKLGRSILCVIVVCAAIYCIDKVINKTKLRVLLGRT